MRIMAGVNRLSSMQSRAIVVLLTSKNQSDAARKMGLSRSAFSDRVRRASLKIEPEALERFVRATRRRFARVVQLSTFQDN